MTARRVGMAIICIVAVALVIFALRSMLGDDSEPDSADPVPSQEPDWNSDYIEKNIAERLSAKEGRQVVAECPETISVDIGTEFTCDVKYAGTDEVVSIAEVEIDGPEGHFKWESEPADDDDE